MTWAEFKEKIEGEGVTDNMEIIFIDVSQGPRGFEFYVHVDQKTKSFNAY